MRYRYAFKSDKENLVKAVGRDLSISTKQAVELCSFIKKMPLAKARAILEKVRNKQLAVPFKRFTDGAGHKQGKGICAGKYPYKASKQFLKLLKALEANAQNKGLSSNLKIIHACAQRAATPLHYGRKRSIVMKRTHVELVAEEMEYVKKEEKAKTKKEEKREEKQEEKQEEKKEEKKGEEKKAKERTVKPKPEIKKKTEKRKESKETKKKEKTKEKKATKPKAKTKEKKEK
ncbi:50S ribosomal protein L22 [Candidatus Woesearchaeota archaeon]|nr:50S ribosomal protein L22 [Candidatus Woesearchaeota archaeon]